VSVALFPFRYRDPRTGRWINARYKAAPHEIAARHAEWEITGPAEIRSPIGGSFNPYRVVSHRELKGWEEPAPQINPHLERPPTIDAAECFLTSLFLRRYIAYCARRRRYAHLQGAARLYREMTATLEALA
jgi:hypothetical protein